ncbi:hypothetical protein DPMN_146699 [Dreissena polymorpha]|uniref:Uncharacterized protein n=1 Tax=Dreissena polymorpha TaxID=45954 RepID=A0A9D4F6B7_DREPO|nr:hypothetical protein DPMN_146699 [Dreissena polymorpha]
MTECLTKQLLTQTMCRRQTPHHHRQMGPRETMVYWKTLWISQLKNRQCLDPQMIQMSL